MLLQPCWLRLGLSISNLPPGLICGLGRDVLHFPLMRHLVRKHTVLTSSVLTEPAHALLCCINPVLDATLTRPRAKRLGCCDSSLGVSRTQRILFRSDTDRIR